MDPNKIKVRQNLDNIWRKRDPEDLETALVEMENHIAEIAGNRDIGHEERSELMIVGYARMLSYFPGNRKAQAYILSSAE